VSEGKKGKICYVGMGSSIHVQRWVNHLVADGWDIDLITFEPAKPKEIDPRVRQHVVRPGGIPGLGFVKAFLGVRKALKKIKPDVIHAHSIPAYGIYAGLYSRFGGKEPIVLSPWGFHHIKKNKGIKRWLDRLALEKAVAIAVTSPDLKEELVKNFGTDTTKFRVFSWGIDLSIFKINYVDEMKVLRHELNIAENNRVILSSRNMSPYYRIHNIIKSLPLILESHPDVILILLKGFGSDEYEKEMKVLVKESGIENNVRFVSKVISLREMAIYMNLSKIMVSMIITDQLPAVLMESLASGTFPIIPSINLSLVFKVAHAVIMPKMMKLIMTMKIILLFIL